MRAAAIQRRRSLGRWIVLSMLVLLLPVSQLPAAAAEPQVLEKSKLVLESGERTFRFEVELAAEAEERRGGLMQRREMGADRGMLFDFGGTAPVSMWMRNTSIPLDMLFIDEGGEVVNGGHDVLFHSKVILSFVE